MSQINHTSFDLTDAIITFVPPCGKRYDARVRGVEHYGDVELVRVEYIVAANRISGTPEMTMQALVSPSDIIQYRWERPVTSKFASALKALGVIA